MRNPKLQKKGIDYAIKNATPFIQSTSSDMLNQLSTKIRPKRNYKTNRKDLDGGAIDIHKWIGKLPKPKGGFTPSDYKYIAPYNPLDKQLKNNPETGEVLEWYVKPKNKVDEIAAYHDVCYDMGKTKMIVTNRWLNHLIKFHMDRCPNGD